MPTESKPPDTERFRPHAVRELAGMFDDVSGRYDLLNRVMTLGQDDAWRAAMWREVPEDARACLDLCTGNGVSLSGLRRPGRRVIGIDVSLGMLQHAARATDRRPWSPHLACADAFRLPLRDRSVDAITIAFGVRNLRPRAQALTEMGRVLRAGGTLAVLEAAAPAGGRFATLHAFYLRRLIPLAGRLSDDPSAYEYLSRSVFEFGAGPEFEHDLETCGFTVVSKRSFMMGATRLWVARAGARAGGEEPLQNALRAAPGGSEMPQSGHPLEAEWRGWMLAQAAISGTLTVALIFGLTTLAGTGVGFSLEPWQRRGLWALLIAGGVAFGVRTILLLTRLKGPPRRR